LSHKMFNVWAMAMACHPFSSMMWASTAQRRSSPFSGLPHCQPATRRDNPPSPTSHPVWPVAGLKPTGQSFIVPIVNGLAGHLLYPL
jgi:hypothetical protein